MGASVEGTSHKSNDIPCQDASLCRVLTSPSGEPVLVALVSDGAGSASCASDGSLLACETFFAGIQVSLDSGTAVRDLDKKLVQSWIAEFQENVDTQVDGKELLRRDFACTILAAVIGEEFGVLFQIGDGVIVVEDHGVEDEYRWIFWPQAGEYESSTYFLTHDDALSRLECKLTDCSIDRIALLTDGLQRLALRFQDQTVHGPFFRPMFPPLERKFAGDAVDLTNSLKLFLDSPAVNARTDDDKTLVLASRKSGA